MKNKTNFYNKQFSQEISNGINKFWLGLNRFYQQKKNFKNKNKCFNFKTFTLSNILDTTYDILICLFSIIDMIFDIIVTRHFYINQHYIFFYCSIIILLIAQISYSAFVAIGLEPIIPSHITDWKEKCRYQQWKHYLAFIFVFPFGQLVPLILMVQNSNKHIKYKFNKFYKRFGYENRMDLDIEQNLFQVGSNNDKKECDPLSVYIRQKFLSHLGFLIEAITESIPQSILQMIFLIMYPPDLSTTNCWINILSIIMSMIVVISKGAMISYSFYRKASIFNFLCFAIDVFGFFTVISWLFCASTIMNIMHSEMYIINLYGLYIFEIWIPASFYFKILYYILRLLIIMVPAWIGFLIHVHYCVNMHHFWKEIDFFILAITFWVAASLPILVVVLMIRFTLIPLIVMKSYDHSNNKLFTFYNIIYPFLTQSNSFNEIHSKLLLTNWMTMDINTNKINCCNSCDCLYWSSTGTYCKQLRNEYELKGSLSLSYFYEIIGETFTAKYHKIIEISKILISRVTFWKFIAYKIISFFYSNYDDRNWKKLEKEFWEIMITIRDIIGFDKEIAGNNIQSWFDYKIKNPIQNSINYLKNIFFDAIYKIKCYKQFLNWFINGLYDALYQDIYNFYAKILYLISGKNKKMCKKLRWNIPKCWEKFIFTDETYKNDEEYIYFFESIECNNDPWIGKGLFVFIVVIIFKCIHMPICNLATSKIWEKCCAIIIIVCFIIGCLLLIILATYSLFLPFYFVIEYLYLVGISNDLMIENTLQITLTVIYFIIFSVMLLLLPNVWKFIYCNLHLYVNEFFIHKKPKKGYREQVAKYVIEVYDATKYRNDLIQNSFGMDICSIILSYLGQWNLLKYPK